MRWGLRLQLLVLLGIAMALGFLPLLFATSTYTKVAIERLSADFTDELSRSVAGKLALDRRRLPPARLLEELEAQVTSGAVGAVGVYEPSGQAVARVGSPELVELLGAGPVDDERKAQGGGGRETTKRVRLPSGGLVVVTFVPDRFGGVSTARRVDSAADASAPLARLVSLYIGVTALTVLVLTYFAVTRWIIQPILALERSAERVALGGHRLVPLDRAPDELVRLSHSLTRMTERLRAEEEALRRKIDEVQRKTEELRSAQASLVSSERLASVGRLAAGLAHEVGNPLSAIMGMQDLLLDGDLTPSETEDFLRRMKKETARIHRVLSDLLAFARPSRQLHGRSAEEPGSIAEAASDLVALLAPQKDFRGIRLETHIEPNLPTVGLGHEELTQVLLNLVINARDAIASTGAGGSGSEVDELLRSEEVTGRIVVRASRSSKDPGLVELVVEDDGPGIPSEVAETLFEPFVSTKDVGRGTGLGLSVTRGLVVGASGSVVALPNEPRGARFLVELPATSPR